MFGAIVLGCAGVIGAALTEVAVGHEVSTAQQLVFGGISACFFALGWFARASKP